MSISPNIAGQVSTRPLIFAQQACGFYPRQKCGCDSGSVATHSKFVRRGEPIDRNIAAGCDVFRAGESGEAIYYLTEGWVVLYSLLGDGSRQILQFALPGAVLAFASAPVNVMRNSAQALTNAAVRVMRHEKLERLGRETPEFGLRLAGAIVRDRNLAFEHLCNIGRRSARERVAYLLLELFVRARLQWPGHRSQEMQLPLTQEHIGDATGLTGVHVNRVLRDLRKDGVLEFHYRRLHILNPDKLVDIAKPDPHVASSWIEDTSLSDMMPKF